MDLRGVSAVARAQPGRAAVVVDGRVTTYDQLDDRANRLAGALADLGAQPELPVVAVLPNGVETLEVATATTMLGARYLPVNWHLKAEELAFILADSGAPVAVTDVSLAGQVEPALTAVPGCRTLAVGRDYESAIGAQSPEAARRALSGPSFMFYTSGTTARPKGVVHGHHDPDRRVVVQEGQVSLWRWASDEVFLMTGPAYHAAHGGWAGTALYVGATTVVMRSWDAREWMRLTEAHGATRSFMVPAQFIRLLEVPESERRRHDLSSMSLIVHAAAPCPVPVKRRMMEALPGCEIHELYGASEGGATRISPGEWLEHPGSVGTAWPGVEVLVLDEDGHRLGPGEVGVIHVRTPGAARFEYRNDPGATAEAWRGDAFTVGDIGYVDSEGYLYITDRKSDMVLWGGVNIAPREIEDALHEHPAVVDCCVFGIPDERDGEHLKAMVEARAGTSIEELTAHLRGRIADYKIPHEWELVDALPRDPNGKVLKRRLREAHWSGRVVSGGGG